MFLKFGNFLNLFKRYFVVILKVTLQTFDIFEKEYGVADLMEHIFKIRQ
jgi:hypothetical protein